MELVGKIVFNLFMTYDEYNTEAKNKIKRRKTMREVLNKKVLFRDYGDRDNDVRSDSGEGSGNDQQVYVLI